MYYKDQCNKNIIEGEGNKVFNGIGYHGFKDEFSYINP